MTDNIILRILLDVQSVPNGWQTTYLPILSDGKILEPLPAGWPAARSLEKQNSAAYVFPQLPVSESGSYTPPENLPAGVAEDVHTYCTGADPDKLESLYTNIIRRRPQAATHDVLTYGCYLFEALIGQKAWGVLQKWAADSQADLLEIALCWAPDEIHLHRLNWEMMYGPDGFLTALQILPPKTVVITRMVKGAASQPRAITEVPRYLFVVGAPISDPGIRPGAELLALLRGVDQKNCSLQMRMVSGADDGGATPAEVIRVVQNFTPHIIHFTCHGKFDGFGGAALALQPDQGETKKDFDAEAIIAMLSKAMPGAVVLSACNTGQSSAASPAQPAAAGGTGESLPLFGAHDTAPMAAGLVQRGIPVVVGMAGQVADSACRHFTRCFGQAIVDRAPLVAAVAEGRWAAFAYGQSIETSVDWAFPALFISEQVPPNFTPLQTSGETEYSLVETWIQGLNLKHTNDKIPVFSGRDEFFEAYYRLFEPSPTAALAALVESGRGYGKSRLLEELAMAAIRDGHVPVPLIHISDSINYPNDVETLWSALWDLLKSVLKIYRNTSKVSPLPPLPEWTLPKLEKVTNGSVSIELSGLSDMIQLEWPADNKLSSRVLALALGEDLTKLADYVRLIHPFVQQRQGRPVLLLDDVHLFGNEFMQSWFSGRVMTGYGLGQDTASRIPVVMTLSLDGAGGAAARQVIDPLRTAGHPPSWITLLPLGKFKQTQDKDLLVYELIWLHPFDNPLFPEEYKKPMALVPKQDEKWNHWKNRLRYHVGYPQKLIEDDFFFATEDAVDDNYLQAADDRKMLNDYITKVDSGGH
jgi:hypothetical protein